MRASRRLSASSAQLAAGARTLDAGTLALMREQISSLRTAAERARAVATTERAALPPPQQQPPRGGIAGDCGDVVGSTRHLLFDRLADDTDVEPFAGAELSSPLIMPVELSLPEQIWSLADVSDCLQRAAHARQHGQECLRSHRAGLALTQGHAQDTDSAAFDHACRRAAC